jgi:hypothetical protein
VSLPMEYLVIKPDHDADLKPFLWLSTTRRNSHHCICERGCRPYATLSYKPSAQNERRQQN